MLFWLVGKSRFWWCQKPIFSALKVNKKSIFEAKISITVDEENDLDA